MSQYQDLYAAGRKIHSIDEMKFITILCMCSATHLMRDTGQEESVGATVECPGHRYSVFMLNIHYVMLLSPGVEVKTKKSWCK